MNSEIRGPLSPSENRYYIMIHNSSKLSYKVEMKSLMVGGHRNMKNCTHYNCHSVRNDKNH